MASRKCLLMTLLNSALPDAAFHKLGVGRILCAAPLVSKGLLPPPSIFGTHKIEVIQQVNDVQTPFRFYRFNWHNFSGTSILGWMRRYIA